MKRKMRFAALLCAVCVTAALGGCAIGNGDDIVKQDVYKRQVRDRMSGNEAIAYAMRQINPDVMGAFPITPSTEIPPVSYTHLDVYKRQANGSLVIDSIHICHFYLLLSAVSGGAARSASAHGKLIVCVNCYNYYSTLSR